MAGLFPTTAEGWQRRTNDNRNAGKANITNRQTSTGRIMFPKVTRPVAPARAGDNWNNRLFKGYKTDDLNTYIIRPHEQKQLALFSRYILKDPNAASTPLLERAQLRFVNQKNKPAWDIKQYRNIIGTSGTLMNPIMQKGNG